MPKVKFDDVKCTMEKRESYEKKIEAYMEEMKKRFLNYFEGEGELCRTNTNNLYKIVYQEDAPIYFVIKKFSTRGFVVYLSSDYQIKEYFSEEHGRCTTHKTSCNTHLVVYGDDKAIRDISLLYDYMRSDIGRCDEI